MQELEGTRPLRLANRKDMGMAGYLSDGDLMRYRMLRDQDADRFVKPKHPIRYGYKTKEDKLAKALAVVLFTLMFSVLPAYIIYLMMDPANWWMW